MLDGMDEALQGMTAGESKTFTATLAGGKQAGLAADVLVTVNSVKVKELPQLDDEFAQSASEFDTVGELRASTRQQLSAVRQAGQAGQARERLLESLGEQLEVPLPERVIEAEIGQRRTNLNHQLERAGLTVHEYLEGSAVTAANLEDDLPPHT